MKVKALARDEETFTRERSSDMHKVHRNLDPVLRPMEKATEYTRALAAVKLKKVFAKPFVAALGGHVDGLTCLARSPACLTTLLSASADGEVRLWDLAARAVRFVLPGHVGAVRGVAVSSDGLGCVTAGDDGTARYWRLPPARAALAAPEGEEGADSGDDDDGDNGGGVGRRRSRPVAPSTATGGGGCGFGAGAARSTLPCLSPVASVECGGGVRAADHRWSGAVFATASGAAVEVWDARRSAPLHTLSWGVESVTAVRFNPAEVDIVASAGSDRSLVLYDLRAAAPIRKLVMATRVNAIAWNPREPMNLVAANDDGCLYTYDMRNLGLARGIHKDFTSAAMDVDFSPTGREFVAGSYDRTVRIWGASAGHSREVYHTKRMQRVTAVRFSGDGDYCLSGSDDANVRIWKARAAQQLGVLKPREQRKAAYGAALAQRYAAVPELRRIERHRQLPRGVYKAGQLRAGVREAERKRGARREAHSAPGSTPHTPARKKRIVAVVE